MVYKPRREMITRVSDKVTYHYVIDVKEGQRRLTLDFDHEPDKNEIASELAKWQKTLKDEGWIEREVD